MRDHDGVGGVRTAFSGIIYTSTPLHVDDGNGSAKHATIAAICHVLFTVSPGRRLVLALENKAAHQRLTEAWASNIPQGWSRRAALRPITPPSLDAPAATRGDPPGAVQEKRPYPHSKELAREGLRNVRSTRPYRRTTMEEVLRGRQLVNTSKTLALSLKTGRRERMNLNHTQASVADYTGDRPLLTSGLTCARGTTNGRRGNSYGKVIHGTHKIGEALGREPLWQAATELWERTGRAWPMLRLRTILGAGLLVFACRDEKQDREATRLFEILLTETAFAI
ncbi:hypothetical protein BKA62DRAFT_677586 [Auriculariales sp. MPI-PUGE-AT-0066]|nr:hypothetical protein BKA62DRAFT_677586 [Auriculariales sp. MPI-PUGE-AT-0066]